MRASALALLSALRHSSAVAGRSHTVELNALVIALPYLLKNEPAIGRSCMWHQSASFASQANLDTRSVRKDLFNTHPRSLQFDRPTEEPKPEVAHSRFRQALLTISGFYSKESQLLRGSKNLLQAVVQHTEDPKLYEVFGLERKFADKYNMLCIHMWMLLVRLRSEGKDGKDLAQMMYEAFQDNVEARVRGEGVKVRLNKWLTELEQMFYGMSFSFDKCLRGEGELSASLLKNIYNEDASKQKSADLLARYITRELACLAKTDTEYVINGKIKFSDDVLG